MGGSERRRAYSLGLYEKAMPECSWPEKLKIAKAAGYDFVEISIDASEEKIARVYSSKAERKQLVDWMYELDMPIRTLNASALTKYALGDPDPAVRGRGMDIASHAISLAEDLRSGGSAVAALHLKETKPGFYREIPYGTGHVDFERAVAAAWAIGVRRFVTEFWYKPDGETPEAVCKRCRALLDQQLQE